MDGWSKKRLIEITKKIGSGATPRGGSDAYKDFGISLFRSLNVHDRTFKEKNLAFIDEDQANKLSNVEVQEGDVLLNITGASIARCCIAPSELLPARVNQHVAIIRPKSDYIDSNFLVYLLVSKQYKDTLLNTGEKAGSTRQALTKQQLENFEVTIPKLPEQKRIVAIADEAFEGIDRAIANTEKNLANSRELFGNILNLAIQGKITSKNLDDDLVLDLITQIQEKRNIAIKNKTIRTTKTQSIEEDEKLPPFEIPDHWQWVKLEDLTLVISDGVHKKPKYVSDGVPFVTVRNLTAGAGISFDNLSYITREDHEEFIKRTHPEQGDILISKDGTIGVVRIIDTDIQFSIFVSIALVKPALYEINKYLALALESSIVQKQITPKGTALKHLYLIDLRRLYIPLPSLSEQKRIVEKLNKLSTQIQRLEAIYRQKLAALKELKQSILQKAFTGELTADTPKNVNEEIAA
jgi:type I restriction enzyme, S subunit